MNTALQASVENSYQRSYARMMRSLESPTFEKETAEIVKNRFDDLIVFINDKGNINAYDKHFRVMINSEENAIKNAKEYLYKEALKLAEEEYKKFKRDFMNDVN